MKIFPVSQIKLFKKLKLRKIKTLKNLLFEIIKILNTSTIIKNYKINILINESGNKYQSRINYRRNICKHQKLKVRRECHKQHFLEFLKLEIRVK